MTDALATLLGVQEHDTKLAQLLHRRTHLEQRAELAAVQGELAGLERDLIEPAAARQRFEAGQTKIEDELKTVTAKIGTAERTLYSGSVSSPRELQSLETDIASLKRRRSELEDHELEMMIEREPVDATLADAADRIDALEARRAALIEAIAVEERAIDADAALTTAQRTALVANVTADLLTRYDRARTQNRGVGIARLEHGTCGACHLKLAAVDLDRIRQQPADAIVQCDDCGAVLLRG